MFDLCDPPRARSLQGLKWLNGRVGASQQNAWKVCLVSETLHVASLFHAIYEHLTFKAERAVNKDFKCNAKASKGHPLFTLLLNRAS